MVNNVSVYRLEINGYGIYQYYSGNLLDEAFTIYEDFRKLHGDDITYPGWQTDCINPELSGQNWLAGCSNFEQLIEWFGEELLYDLALTIPDITLVVHQIPDTNNNIQYGISNKQLAFTNSTSHTITPLIDVL